MRLPRRQWQRDATALLLALTMLLATGPNRAQEEQAQQQRFVSQEEMGRYVVPVRSFLDVHGGVPDEKEPDNVESLIITLQKYTERLQGIYDRSLKPGDIHYPDLSWLSVLDLSGGQIHRSRERLGLEAFAASLGITPGDCNTTHGSFWVEREREAIDAIAKRRGLEPSLVIAVLYQESGGNPRCISTTGAMGPAGLTYYLYTSRVWSDGQQREAINPFNYRQAVERSAEYLRFLYDNFQDWRLALAGYHDGESGIAKQIRAVSEAGEAVVAEEVLAKLQSPAAEAYVDAVLKRRDGMNASASQVAQAQIQ